MLKKIFSTKRNIYLFALLAIFVESFASVLMKTGGKFPLVSWQFLFCYGGAIAIMGIYSIMWQLLLEQLPLSTAYLRKGISYILVFMWASLFFGEAITLYQIIGGTVIIVGTVVSQLGDR